MIERSSAVFRILESCVMVEAWYAGSMNNTQELQAEKLLLSRCAVRDALNLF